MAHLSKNTTEMLRAAVRAACEEALAIMHDDKVARYPDPRFTEATWPRAALDIVQEVIAEVARAEYTRQNIAMLPSELLTFVFHPLGDSERLSAALVCKAWRDRLFKTPTLWTNVDFNKPRPRGSLTRYVSLSACIPLERLDVCFSDATNVEVCDILARNIIRARKLSVTINDAPSTAADQHRLNSALSHPAPLLTIFRLFDHGGRWNSEHGEDIHLFANEAPLLKTVKLHCHILALQGSALALASVKQALYASPYSLSAAMVLQLVDMCPSLEELAVEVDGWAHGLHYPPLVFSAPLTDFIVIANRNDFPPAELLSSFDLSTVPHVWLSYNSGTFPDNIDNIVSQFLPPNTTPIRTLRLYGSTYAETTFNLQMYGASVSLHKPVAFDRHTMERVILDVSVNANIAAMKELVQDVVSLYVGERIFHLDALLNEGTLPKLETLIMSIIKPEHQANHGDLSVFFAADEGEMRLPLKCPRLRVVQIAARTGRNDLMLDPTLVLRFLQQYLAYDAPRLPVLVLQGVRLLENNVHDISLLLSYVEEVQVVDGPLEWNQDYPELLHWGYPELDNQP